MDLPRTKKGKGTKCAVVRTGTEFTVKEVLTWGYSESDGLVQFRGTQWQ